MNDVIPDPISLTIERWDGAANRGLKARQQREQIVSRVLKSGEDFGVIPGCGDRPALKKSGAEKIADSLDLWPDYEPLATIEDFDKPLFLYRYRCLLKTRGQNFAVASGIGSANSMEARYRWRDQNRKCPACGLEAIIKGREEYGGGWLCFRKKGGCGAKYSSGDESIETQPTGRIDNDDIFTQVNTIDKMAQKRALVAASLNLGFSDHFTQDIEDAPEAFGGPKMDVTVEPAHQTAPQFTSRKAPRRKQPDPPPNTVVVMDTSRKTGVEITFGKNKGKDLTELTTGSLQWYVHDAHLTFRHADSCHEPGDVNDCRYCKSGRAPSDANVREALRLSEAGGIELKYRREQGEADTAHHIAEGTTPFDDLIEADLLEAIPDTTEAINE